MSKIFFGGMWALKLWIKKERKEKKMVGCFKWDVMVLSSENMESSGAEGDLNWRVGTLGQGVYEEKNINMCPRD